MRTFWDIELRDLRLGYGETVVLENFSAVLPAGKISVILGGSGSGKSTLLRHIIGLARPLSGQILLGGQDLFALPPKAFRRIRRRMGVLFQDGALLGSLTLGENVALPLAEHTRLSPDDIRAIVRHTLFLVNLAGFAGYYPSELSGGMRKRAGLARALVTLPPLLLCDEPTSGLDPVNAAQMDALLLTMKKRFPDMTIVTVSHDMASVRALADHILVLADKTVAYAGDLDGLQKTANPYLRLFLDRAAPREDDGAPCPAAADLDPAVRGRMAEALDSWLESR
ncbi:MAG: ATP-binding cassette domain-containing protein [Desulfovibrio sp.]|jgi:phospholipid/cholesterol/gamma-HCH transport system ATP-binding protein|nr:ATP-binding cassette domain-containing protein [Desulfovibrio sp.]